MNAEPRYRVVEIDGYSRLGNGGSIQPMLSVSVLDSAIGYWELARWNQEHQHTSKAADRRAKIRRLANELAARLNEEHGPP